MAFINKKEEVIKLRLTQHGKHLLSLGKFKPHCYAMFDDDIIYDGRYAGVEEHQNEIQERIKEQIQRDTQHVSVGIETRFGMESDLISLGAALEYESLVRVPTDIENEKILGFPLTNMEFGEQEAPRFDLLVHESEIENTRVEYDMLDGSRIRIPQLTFEPEHTLIRDSMNVDYLSEGIDPGTLVDSEVMIVNPMAKKVDFLDGSFLEHHPEDIVISLRELNAAYLMENFEVEVFEVENPGTEDEKLIPIKKYDNLFEIQVDSDSGAPQKMNQRNSGFFS